MTTSREHREAVLTHLRDYREHQHQLKEQREVDEDLGFEPTPDPNYTGKSLVTIDDLPGHERIIITAITESEFEELRGELPVESL